MITNPEAVLFANQRARVFADALVTSYETAAKFKAQYDAQQLDGQFPNQAGEVVADGADIDGRPPLSGQKVRALYTAAGDLIAWGDAVVAGKARIVWLRGMSVNGASRF